MNLENPIPLFKVFMSEKASHTVSDVLSSGYVTQGPEVEKFEDVLKEFFDNDRVITTKKEYLYCFRSIFCFTSNFPHVERIWPWRK